MVNELLRRILFLPPQSSTVAREIDYLHYFVIVTTMAGAALITVVGAVFTIRYRARQTIAREHPGATPPRWMEFGVVTGLLGLFCLWWVIGFLLFLRVRVPPENAMTVYVTAKQWMWKFAYPDGQSTISALYVPTGRPIRLLLGSRDVVHSFYVPDFRVKYDAVPGRYTTLWFEVPAPGTHQVLCAEYCGVGHSEMRAEVVALAPEDYARWAAGARRHEEPVPRVALEGPASDEPLSTQGAAPREALSLVRIGEQVAAQQGCLRCHTLDGSPHIGPTWAGLYRSMVPIKDGPRVLADEAYLTESMMDPLAKIHEGYAPVMPSYHGLLSPAETAAIVQLIRSVAQVPGQRESEPQVAAMPSGPAPPAGQIGQVLTAPAGLQAVPGQPPQLEAGLPLPGAQREPPVAGEIEAIAPARRSAVEDEAPRHTHHKRREGGR